MKTTANYTISPVIICEIKHCLKMIIYISSLILTNSRKNTFFREFFVTFRTLFVDMKLETVKSIVTMWFTLTTCMKETLLENDNIHIQPKIDKIAKKYIFFVSFSPLFEHNLSTKNSKKGN